MKIIIAGAGAVGTHLARLLSQENLNVVLIDPGEDRLAKLNSDLDIMTSAVDPTSISGLKSGSEVAVYSLDGKVLMRSHADSDGNASLNLQSATSGIYIIKTPTRTIKITK